MWLEIFHLSVPEAMLLSEMMHFLHTVWYMLETFIKTSNDLIRTIAVVLNERDEVSHASGNYFKPRCKHYGSEEIFKCTLCLDLDNWKHCMKNMII